MALNPRQSKFIDEYLDCGIATEAAVRAGYSPTTAQEQSSRLLSKVMVRAELSRRQEALREHVVFSQKMIAQELAAIGFANMRTYAEWGPDGVSLVDKNQLEDEAMGAIAELSETPGKFGKRISIKLHDKLSALEKLARMLGYMKERGTLDEFLDALAAIDPDLAGRVRRRLAEHLRVQRGGNRSSGPEADEPIAV